MFMFRGDGVRVEWFIPQASSSPDGTKVSSKTSLPFSSGQIPPGSYVCIPCSARKFRLCLALALKKSITLACSPSADAATSVGQAPSAAVAVFAGG